jgi:hypothetical protein
MDLIQKYLDSISKKLRLNRKKEEEIIKEIKTHLEDLILEYKKGGISVKKAEQRAIEKFGNPKKIARKLQWIHGFGSFSDSKIKDAFLGTLPFLIASVLILLLELNFITKFSYLFGFFWALITGVSIYGVTKAFPAWTISWLGFFNVIILHLLFFAGAYVSPLFSVILLSFFLIFSIYFIVKNQSKFIFLFLMPLAIPYVFYGYDGIIQSHRISMEIIVCIFTITVSFLNLYKKFKGNYLIGVFGFLLYSFIYFDVVFFAPLQSPFEKNYLGLLPTILGYLIPLFIISLVPGYYFLKQKSY